MNSLVAYLREKIEMDGPMDIGIFMALALGHPQHGYYMKKDPFGADGDFTTAPEISQMFGEMIGVWVADVWMKMGAPGKFTLLECGPGRGTLMADLLRATKKIEGFHAAARVHLLEMNPVLRAAQEKALAGFNVLWHENLESVPVGDPVILIANEFLDALPVRQFVMMDDGWMERVVEIVGGELRFGARSPSPLIPLPHEEWGRGKLGDVMEISPARAEFAEGVCAMLKKAGGAALFIDYGHAVSGVGDTLQAVCKHSFCSPLEHVGDADLTSHVDFGALKEAAVKAGVAVQGPVEQGAFLKALGIEARAASLSAKATDKQRADIESGLRRLTASDQMGTLFKVMGLTYDQALELSGF